LNKENKVLGNKIVDIKEFMGDLTSAEEKKELEFTLNTLSEDLI
jgi:hypothetical protein